MKLLFDQNISHRILRHLPEQFHNSTSVKNEGLINADDRTIWEFARQNGYIIVTQDSDFNDLNSLYGFPPKIIWIRTGNLSTNQFVDILNVYVLDIEKFLNDDNFGCFEIITLKRQ